MLAPEALAAVTAGHAGCAYQPRQGSRLHLSEELACFVTAAASESQRCLSAAVRMASKASFSLHAHSVGMAAHLNGFLLPVVQLCGGSAKMAMQSMLSTLEGLCPACMAPVKSAGEAIRQLSVQHDLRLGSPEAMGSELRHSEQLASWAPAKPSSVASKLLSASQTLLSIVPEPVTRKVTGAWASAGSWLHMCASWQPSQQPQLTALHSAAFLAHDSANIALHSLKQAAGCACSISAQAAAAWKSTRSLLQYASLAMMTDAERDAHLASKVPSHDSLGPAALDQAPAIGKGVAGWLGSLWEGKRSRSASTADRLEDLTVVADSAQPAQADMSASHTDEESSAAAQHAEGEVLEISSGLSHVQLDNGGVITWDGQPGQAGQPEPPSGKEAGELEDGVAPDDAQPHASEVEHIAGLQHVESAEGGTVTWAGQPEQPAPDAVDASLEPSELDEGAPSPSEEEPAVALSHTRTEGGGSVTWTGQAPQPDTQHETAHLDVAATEEAGSPVPDNGHQKVGGEPDQDAEASGSSGSCGTLSAGQSEPEAHKPDADSQAADVPHAEAGADSLSEHAIEDNNLDSSDTGDTGQEPSEPAPGALAASAGAEPSMGKADSPDDSVSRGGGADVSCESPQVREQDSSDGSTEEHLSSSAEGIAAALADAVHTLEEALVMQQPDQDSGVHKDEGASDVAHSPVPAAALSRLSKLAEVGLKP